MNASESPHLMRFFPLSPRGHRWSGGIAVIVLLTLAAVGYGSVSPLTERATSVPVFDGQEVYLELPHAAPLALDHGGTIEAWIQVADRTDHGWPRIACTSGTHADDGGWSFMLDNDRYLRLAVGRTGRSTRAAAIEPGRWHHVAVSFGEGAWRFYLDGELLIEFEADELPVADDAPLRIGDSAAGERTFSGLIQDVRVWDHVRSPGQIAEHHDRVLSGEEAGLLVYLPLTEGQGAVARDLAGDREAVFSRPPRWRAVRMYEQDLRPRDAVMGEPVTLGPVALRDARGRVSYQWYFDGRAIEGATADRLRIDAVAPEHLGWYHVVADDAREQTPVATRRVRLAEPDWPTWRFDTSRSAATGHELAEELHLHWVRQLPEPRRAWRHQWDDGGKLEFDVGYVPIVQGERLFIASNVTDSVTAYDLDGGGELWRFFADGPVRLAPTAWGGRVYFVSDDGHLYCVDAASGELVWRFRGGPSEHRLLGNERLINLWPARGAATVEDGVVYFAAGIWPLHGVFIHALDAETGEPIWVNDTTSSDYVPLPHGGAYGYGGLAPQGYIAVGDDTLVVAGGRAPPGYFDRHDGRVVRLDPREAHKGGGNYAVHAQGKGRKRNDRIARYVEQVAGQLDGEVVYKAAARGRLFVSTDTGRIYCFGAEPRRARVHEHQPGALARGADEWARVAGALLEDLGESGGYALVLGAGSGDLARELVALSDMHVLIVEADAERVGALRRELVEAGVHGERAVVMRAEPASFTVQPYLFSLVVSEDATAAELVAESEAMARLLGWLRPYGGRAYLGGASAPLASAARKAVVDRVSVQVHDGRIEAWRDGPLTGAGQWTHQLQCPANTLLAADDRVRLPLGVLWFGGPSHDDILPRHAGGPRPQVAGGRQVFLGVETISARCVYTGRTLWRREFPGIGHPFTNLELERRWADGDEVYMTNIPGATYIGSPFVTLPDAVYLRYDAAIHRLDPATGQTTAQFPLAPRRQRDDVDWGHVSVRGDWLISTAEPHIFEDQELGWTDSYSGTSSGRIVVMDRHSGEVKWQRAATIGFRHNAIVSSDDTLYLIDGLSENALEHMARRGRVPEQPSLILALDLETGQERWRSDSEVMGTFLIHSAEHEILIEGGNVDLRRPLDDEPRQLVARDARTGAVLWQRGGSFTLPAAVRGDVLIPGRPGTARSLVTGEDHMRVQAHLGEQTPWSYDRAYGCNTLNASRHLLLYRSGYAGYFDLEHDSGTGTFGGFRSGCTANMIAADGVLNALDYTRTCTCSYAHQTSLALVHMPGDDNIEQWTRYSATAPDPRGHRINFGAPGRRVDDAGRVWHDRQGTHRRHPSAVDAGEAGIAWVAASARQLAAGQSIVVTDLLNRRYTLRLHFAELETGVEAGDRVFDVYVDGRRVLVGVDAVAETGRALHAVVHEVQVSVDHELSLELRRGDGASFNPMIAGLELTAEEP